MNAPVTGEFSAQRASNAENVSIWWSHHDNRAFELQMMKLMNGIYDIGTAKNSRILHLYIPKAKELNR